MIFAPHLRHHSTVEAWIAEYQRDEHSRYPDCSGCGWPHAKPLLCGRGAAFGIATFGGQRVWIDTSNVESLVRQRESMARGFHWRNDIYFERVGDEVVVQFVEHFNGSPNLKEWRIPAAEWESIVGAVRPPDSEGKR